jgi:beta-phosphoglucomutase-like phosphatase (HAD superfamily)
MLYISKFKHCIFDFDGVIIDSERLKFKNLKDILKKYDFDLKDDYFFDFVGKKRGYFIKELKNKKLNENLSEIMTEIHRIDFDLS